MNAANARSAVARVSRLEAVAAVNVMPAGRIVQVSLKLSDQSLGAELFREFRACPSGETCSRLQHAGAPHVDVPQFPQRLPNKKDRVAGYRCLGIDAHLDLA